MVLRQVQLDEECGCKSKVAVTEVADSDSRHK